MHDSPLVGLAEQLAAKQQDIDNGLLLSDIIRVVVTIITVTIFQI